jgi:hypothetical protein
VTGRSHYGQLLHDAGQHILTASVALEGQRFANKAAAARATTVYVDVLHALGRHGQQLLGFDSRFRPIRVAGNDPRDAIAARLVDHLAHVGRRDLGTRTRNPPVSSAWVAAASSVRAATDLLATHQDQFGGWRSPSAALLEDASMRAAAFGELAAVTIPVASAATSLGLRAGQAGIDWAEVEELVPATGPLLEVALEARSLGGLAGFGAPLAELGVARPAVRFGDPVVELGDRLARLHRMAWQLTREEQVGACTLADFSVAGVLVHDYAGQLMRDVGASKGSPVDLGARRGLARLEEGGAAWRLVHLHVRQLRTTTPALVGLRADVVAVRQLLDELVVLPGASASRRLKAVVVGGARGFGDVARWNLQVVDQLDRRGQLLVPGRFLTGNEVSDHPVLVEAKLKGRMGPALKERLEPLRAAYKAASMAAVVGTHGADVHSASIDNPGRVPQA